MLHAIFERFTPWLLDNDQKYPKLSFKYLLILVMIHIHTLHAYKYFALLKAKKMENYIEGFYKLHMIILIYVYALAQIRQVK